MRHCPQPSPLVVWVFTLAAGWGLYKLLTGFFSYVERVCS